jgi:integrase
MAENLLSDARVRAASFERDGHYLADGGGLRIRLLPASGKHPKGARLAEFHFKITQPDGRRRNGALHLGTLGEPHTDEAGRIRPFTLKDARAARDAARELVSKGIDPREARKLAEAEAAEAQRRRLLALEGRRTVRQAFEQWRALYLSAHRKDGGQAVADLFDRHLFPTLGDLPLEELRRQQVTAALDKLTGAGRRRTANMALSVMRQFVRWCALRDWLQHDPTLALSKAAIGGKDKPRERVLSALEIVRLRDALPASRLPQRLQHAVWLLLATGARVGELSHARAADFDLAAKRWHIPETKNGAAHVVQLSDFALRHVEALLSLRGGSAYLLPGRAGDDEDDRPINDKFISKAVHDRQRETPLKGRTKKAAAALVLPRGKWAPHDLRRTMATRMRDLGVSSDVIERCLNHKPQGIVAVYQRAELLPERRAAFDAWGRELQRLMSLDASNVIELQADGREAA